MIGDGDADHDKPSDRRYRLHVLDEGDDRQRSGGGVHMGSLVRHVFSDRPSRGMRTGPQYLLASRELRPLALMQKGARVERALVQQGADIAWMQQARGTTQKQG